MRPWLPPSGEVRALLLRLPPDQRRILELRLAGLTGPEIAAVLGKRLGAVKVAQSRAIARLRQILADDRAKSSAQYTEPEEAIRVQTR
jgi:DNA-directed RNA polymerase specialized sigma24 family protein